MLAHETSSHMSRVHLLDVEFNGQISRWPCRILCPRYIRLYRKQAGKGFSRHNPLIFRRNSGFTCMTVILLAYLFIDVLQWQEPPPHHQRAFPGKSASRSYLIAMMRHQAEILIQTVSDVPPGNFQSSCKRIVEVPHHAKGGSPVLQNCHCDILDSLVAPTCHSRAAGTCVYGFKNHVAVMHSAYRLQTTCKRHVHIGRRAMLGGTTVKGGFFNLWNSNCRVDA
jgi:hypothetical protein